MLSVAWSVVTELNRARQVLQPVLTTVTRTWTTARSAGLATATAIALARARWQRSAPLREQALNLQCTVLHRWCQILHRHGGDRRQVQGADEIAC